MKSKIMKISSGTNRVEDRVLFVFNDLFLLVSERSIGLGGKYKLRAIFDAFFTQVIIDLACLIEQSLDL